MSTTPAAPTEPNDNAAAHQAAGQAAQADAPDTSQATGADLPDVPHASEATEASPLTELAGAPAGQPADAGASGEVPKAAGPDQTPAATAARLAELFPALFAGPAKPFKLRIQVDIQERAPGVFSKQALAAFFRRHTGATSYLLAVAKGTHRFDLDGQPAGELSEEHRKVAADELARRRANVQAKRELEDQQRRNRATLLRDFETTKLTTANFCALKGVPVEALDGLLALARQDALEDAQRPRRPDQGRPQDRREHRNGPGNAPRNAPRHDGPKGAGSGQRRDGGRPTGPQAPGEARAETREPRGPRPPRRP